MNATIETKTRQAGCLKGLVKWLRCPPRQNAIFGTNIRKAIQAIWGTVCQWEKRRDPGEEEHGINFCKRYCLHCGRCQKLYYDEYRETPYKWEDEAAQ